MQAPHGASPPSKEAGKFETPAEPNERDIQKADEALKFLRTEAEEGIEQQVDEKQLLRKIDIMIVPLMFFTYALQYLDKSLLNYASVMGILTDANLDTNEYANLSLFFYVSYLFFEFPHAYAMQRLPTGKYLGVVVICWGVVVASTSACNSYGSLVAIRLLLGMFESAAAPALILITSMWYKRQEQPPRVGSWYFGVGMSVMAGSLISFGFQHYHARLFSSWQIMFLIVGILTVIHGVVLVLLLPDNPMSSRLSHAEKVLAVERLRENQTGIENKEFKFYQVLECFKDPQTYLIMVIVISNSVPNGAVSSFQSILISSFGFSDENTALLQIPSGFIAACSVLFFTWVAGRYNCRGINIIIITSIGGILGGALLAFLPGQTNPAKLFAIYLNQIIGAFLPLSYSFAAANFAGHTKKVTMNALLLICFCTGNIIGPKTFVDRQAPSYSSAKITIVATTSLALVTTVLLLIYYHWENRRRDRLSQQAGIVHKKDQEFLDLTDRENLDLRYRL